MQPDSGIGCNKEKRRSSQLSIFHTNNLQSNYLFIFKKISILYRQYIISVTWWRKYALRFKKWHKKRVINFTAIWLQRTTIIKNELHLPLIINKTDIGNGNYQGKKLK